VPSEVLGPDIDSSSIQLNTQLPDSVPSLVPNIEELQRHGRHRPYGEVETVLWKGLVAKVKSRIIRNGCI